MPNDRACTNTDIDVLDVPAFAVVTRIADSEGRVQIRGDLDCATAPVLDELLCDVLSNGITSIVIDLEQLSFLGVAGLNVLVRAQQRARAAGGRLVLLNAGRTARRVFTVTGLGAMLAAPNG